MGNNRTGQKHMRSWQPHLPPNGSRLSRHSSADSSDIKFDAWLLPSASRIIIIIKKRERNSRKREVEGKFFGEGHKIFGPDIFRAVVGMDVDFLYRFITVAIVATRSAFRTLGFIQLPFVRVLLCWGAHWNYVFFRWSMLLSLSLVDLIHSFWNVIDMFRFILVLHYTLGDQTTYSLFNL